MNNEEFTVLVSEIKIPVFQEGWIFMTIKTSAMMVFETSKYQQHTIHRMMKCKK